MARIVRRRKKSSVQHTPSESRTISAVLDTPDQIEEIQVEGFKRGFNTRSSAAKKIIELGLAEFKKLPVLESRS